MTRTAVLRLTVVALLLCAGASATAAPDPNDRQGVKDPPLFTRMPGFHIDGGEELEFDRYKFLVGPGKTEAIEGRRYTVHYALNQGVKTPSGLQVTRNYANANKAAGGQTVYEYEDGGYENVVLKLVKGDTEYWTYVTGANNGMYSVHMVERTAMTQEVVADAKAWAGSLRETGKAVVYGIHFDTGKAIVKPESRAALTEIAKLLQADARLKLHVVGHTDAVGSFGDNMKLSQSRAAAVVQALISDHGVAAARLAPHGVGPLAPAAPNDSDAGRAKNRRVELVKQ